VDEEEAEEQAGAEPTAWTPRDHHACDEDDPEQDGLHVLRGQQHAAERQEQAEQPAVRVRLVLEHLSRDRIVRERSARRVAMKRKNRGVRVVRGQERVEQRRLVPVVPAPRPVQEQREHQRRARRLRPIEWLRGQERPERRARHGPHPRAGAPAHPPEATRERRARPGRNSFELFQHGRNA
jgi:hypothetical protein